MLSYTFSKIAKSNSTLDCFTPSFLMVGICTLIW